jgi:LPXTG-motif cell wall-anchored protein
MKKVFFLGFVALAAAAWGLAQQPYSAVPTDKDYRMRILEPKEGATIVGTDVTIVLGEPFVPTGAGVTEKQQKDLLTPTFQVWIDGKNLGNVPIGSNVFNAHNLSYGPHKIVVVAKNAGGDVVDRKEIGVTTVAAAETTAQTTTAATAPPPPAPVVQPAPQPEAPPAPAPAPAVEAPAPPAPPSTMPQTGSSYPRMAAAGLVLLAAGLALRRRRA